MWALSLVWALVFAGLAYIAFSGKGITIPSRFSLYRGITSGVYSIARHYQGKEAIQVGFFMIAAALFPFYVLASVFRFYERLVALVLVLGWLGSIAAYMLWA